MDQVVIAKKKKIIKKENPSFINSVLDSWPIEMHYPGYSFLGPGTNLIDKLAKGETGVNPLDRGALKHDLAYFNNENRRAADKELMELALSRLHAQDADPDEKVAAVLTACCVVSKLSLEKFCAKVKKVFNRKTGKKQLDKKKKKKKAKNAQGERKEKKEGEKKNKTSESRAARIVLRPAKTHRIRRSS